MTTNAPAPYGQVCAKPLGHPGRLAERRTAGGQHQVGPREYKVNIVGVAVVRIGSRR
jgi:hypothetical protein